MTKLILASVSILLCHLGVFSQSFYVSTHKDPLCSSCGFVIYKVTLTPTGFESEQLSSCANNFNSIAMNSKGFYWSSGTKLYKGDLNGTSIINCEEVASTPIGSNALTVGNDGKAYYTGKSLYTTDISTGVATEVGAMSYASSGDLTFFKGGLYMASQQGIIKIDTADISKSDLYIPFDVSLNIYGLVSVATSLNKNTVYALSSQLSFTNIIEIDLDNQAIIGVVGTLPFNVQDAASIVEDGSLYGFGIEEVTITQNCEAPETGVVTVIPTVHTDDLIYELNGITNTTGVFKGISAGTYQLIIRSSEEQDSVEVIVPVFSLNKPFPVIVKDNPTCGDPGSISFTINNNSDKYTIQYGALLYPTNHVFSGLNAGNYHFSFLQKNGCVAEILDITLLEEPCSMVSFPSAFTPNQDGTNDVFRALPDSSAPDFRLMIYNRWGELLFMSSRLQEGWKGEYKGKAVPMGTYYWVATFTTSDKKPAMQKGSVTLIR